MKNLPFKKLINFGVFALCLALGIVYLIYTLNIKEGQALAVIGFSLLGIVVSYIFTIIFHEIGHLVFGSFAGLKLCYIKFFGLQFGKNNKGKFSILIDKHDVLSSETAFYPSNGNDVAFKIGLSAMGGPLFTFFQIIAQFIVVATCLNNTALFCILGTSFIVPLYVFLINIIPFSYNYDGFVIFTMLGGGKKALIASSYVTASSLISSGTSPEKLSGRFLTAYDLGYDFYSVKIILLRYYSLLLSNEDSAFSELDKISDTLKLPDGTYADTLYELYFRALVVGDEKFISEYKEEVNEYLDEDDSPTSFRVQVALATHNGELERAKLLCESGLKICEGYYNVGMAEFEKQILSRFLDSF